MQTVVHAPNPSVFQKPALSDSQLVNQYCSGNTKALTVLIERHRQKLFRFIYSKVQDQDIASDLVQDTFLKVINTLNKGGYKEEGKFLPWSMRIAHNLVIDHFRRLKKMPLQYERAEYSVFSFISDNAMTKEDTMIQDHIQSNLHQIINCLPEDQLEVIEMRIFKEMSFKDISIQTGVSINTALGRMRYALINIRKIAAAHQIDLLAS